MNCIAFLWWWLEADYTCFQFCILWGQLKSSQALLTSANPFLLSVGITLLETLQLGIAVRQIWIRPIHLFIGTRLARLHLLCFYVTTVLLHNFSPRSLFDLLLLLCSFIFNRFHFIKQETFWLSSSKMRKQGLNLFLWAFPWNCCSWHFCMAGRLLKGKLLSSWGRGRVLLEMWEITALSRGPEIPGG